MALTFQTTECSRCGGSGRYSYNSVHGDMCYGCNGAGKVYTKAAKAAREIWTAIARPTIPVEDVQPGMKLYVRSMSKRGAAEVESVGPQYIGDRLINPGMLMIQFVPGSILGGMGVWEGHTVQLAKTRESHRAAWDAVKDHPGVVTIPDKTAA